MSLQILGAAQFLGRSFGLADRLARVSLTDLHHHKVDLIAVSGV